MRRPFDRSLAPLTRFETFQLYVNYALGMPLALFTGQAKEFREFVLDWVYYTRSKNTCKKISAEVEQVEKTEDVVESEVVLASGVSEKGRKMYEMYEARFGRKNDSTNEVATDHHLHERKEGEEGITGSNGSVLG